MKFTPGYLILFLAVCCVVPSCKKDHEDRKSRLKEVVYLDSQSKMELKYSLYGKLLSTMPDGADSIFYDSQGRLSKYFDGYVMYAYEYVSNSQIKRRTPIWTISPGITPDTIEYHYDSEGRIVQCTSTFRDQAGIDRQGWIRNYSYSDQNDILKYTAFHQTYNQNEEDVLTYERGQNPFNLSNSIMFFLNDHFYEALNRHNPKTKKSGDFVSIYLYNYSFNSLPNIQTIRSYSLGQPVNPTGYSSQWQVHFIYE